MTGTKHAQTSSIQISMRYISTRPVSKTLMSKASAIAVAFRAQSKKSSPEFARLGDFGEIGNLAALDYIVYEGDFSVFAIDEEHFFFMAASIFGEVLCRQLKFKWCEITLSYGTMLAAVHPYNNLRIPLEASIVGKLSGTPQYDGFQSLFLDIYLSSFDWPPGHHFMNDMLLEIEDVEYSSYWGFVPPIDVRDRIRRLLRFDHEQAIRNFGTRSFEWFGLPDWDTIRELLDEVEGRFVELFPSGWREYLKSHPVQNRGQG